MECIDNISVYETLWSQLPFTGFSDDQKERLPFWKEYALKAIALLYSKNIGIVAETGAGKTIIAHLVSIARYNRILFVVPERVLSHQHKELLISMSEERYSYQVLLGDSSYKERKWNDTFYTFTTPQTFLADYNRWKNSMEYDLVIIDEFHKGRGLYSYKPLAHLAWTHSIPIMGLSASPGKKEEDITEVLRGLYLEDILAVPSPEKEKKRFSFPTFISPNKHLIWIEKKIHCVIQDIFIELGRMGYMRFVRGRKYLSENDIRAIKHAASKTRGYTRYRTLYFLGVYRKVFHILKTALTETYGSAIAYWEGKLSKDTSKSGMYVKNHPTVNLVISYIRGLSDQKDHPKVGRFISVIKHGYIPSIVGIVFVNNRKTGEVLEEIARGAGKQVGRIVGGMSVKMQKEKLRPLASREIDLLIATSVIEEGVAVPEVGYVLNYSVPLNEIALIQRGGRTGRVTYGNIEYIILDHPIDTVSFFSSARGAKKMREIIGLSCDKKSARKGKRRVHQYQLF